MPKETVTLPPGHYIIGDPRYLRKYEPYYHRFYTNGDGGFFDNFKNTYFVDSARIAIFAVDRMSDSLPEGTHHFFFSNAWTIDFNTHAMLEQIKITTSEFSEMKQKRS
ncbi:MAG: hypothetical protein OXU23_01085 [Candidatus Poribacteria bacterium]|nr:hypothetical protein [Candidatus Poribacteria bacterium]